MVARDIPDRKDGQVQLFWSPASPYARKVRAVAREKGLETRISETAVNAYADPKVLLAANPLGKVPTLVLDDGGVLYDSPVICAYLDTIGQGAAMIPEGATRWRVLRGEALADGVMDLALGIVLDGRKPETERSPSAVARWRTQIDRALDHMGDDIGSLPVDVTLAHIALACALEYIDFRLADIDWRSARPALADWHTRIADRPSLRATAPS